MIVGVVDYGMGNLVSVRNALECLGVQSRTFASPEGLEQADRIILPGVGAFGQAMANMRACGLDQALGREVLEKGKPFLGVCLGLQLLGELGREKGEHRGLGWIEGEVDLLFSGNGLRLPHIGWNDVEIRPDSVLFAGLREREAFYFVHSYALFPRSEAVVSGFCEYGVRFAAAVESGNVFATQFHPEKSQKAGLRVLDNFLKARV